MPTASTAQILGNIESFEPLSNHIYVRRTMACEFIVINSMLTTKNIITLLKISFTKTMKTGARITINLGDLKYNSWNKSVHCGHFLYPYKFEVPRKESHDLVRCIKDRQSTVCNLFIFWFPSDSPFPVSILRTTVIHQFSTFMHSWVTMFITGVVDAQRCDRSHWTRYQDIVDMNPMI